MTLPEDTILENRYRIDNLLASGGMGAIYKGYDTNLKTSVAIKENFFQTPESIQQFEQEALILARLRHPSLPRVIHHFSHEGQQYLVMDYIEGKNLWEIVKEQNTPLDEQQAIEHIIQICDAVYYLHQQKPAIIHRDIKPQNIKITPDNQAVLVDFGIAKVGDEDTRTRTGARGVTPGFSPPEQYSGTGTTAVSDVYALGATLYAVLTGKKPPDSISLLIGGANYEPPNIVNPNLSLQVSEAIEHAMKVQQAERPQTALAWKKELESCLEALTAQRLDEKETLAGVTPPGQKKSAVGVKAPDAIGAATTGFWLVDRSGLGYPLGKDPLIIGRHSGADVPIKVLSASRKHAFIRAEGDTCYVKDNNSNNGTFVNNQQLGAGWQAIKPGDVVAIGTTRFNISTTQPARVATVNPQPMSIDSSEDKVETVPEKSKPTDARSTAPSIKPPVAPAAPVSKPAVPQPAAPAKSGVPIVPIIVAALIILGAIGASAYFLLAGGGTPTPTAVTIAEEGGGTEALSDAAVASEQTDEVETSAADQAEAMTRQAEETVDAEATLDAEPEAESNTGELAATEEIEVAPETPTPEDTSTETVAPTEEVTEELIATEEPTSTPSPTQTPTRATPTSQPPTATPQPAGPTVIPVETVESIAEIGSNVPVTAVEINPKNPREVYVLIKGGVNGIFKSTNGGDGPWGRLDIDASGVTDFVLDPTDPSRLFAPAWNAVIRSDDGGNSWKAFGDGLSTANRVVDVIAIDPVSPNIVYGGIGDTLVVSTDGGTSWVSEGYGNGLGQGRLTSIVVDPFNHDVVFVAGEFGSIYKSLNSGRDFQQLAFNTGRGAYSMAVNPEKPDEFLVGINSSEAAIIKTTNGADFVSTSNGLIFGGADSAYSAITYAPSNPNIVYAGSGYEDDGNSKGIFKSVDGGKSWEGISNGLRINPTTGFPHYVRDMAVHPTNPDIVFAGTGWGLYKSTNGGASWELR